jgi:hypothetical protein
MNKAETLTQLHNAKKAHIKWVQRAKALIEGLPVEKDSIPVDCTECKFGQWFYGDGQNLNAIPGMECLQEIERLHFQLHDIYMKIFKVYFGDMNRSFFSKLFKTQKKVTDHDKEIAKAYYENLFGVSQELVGVIDKLERRLHAMTGGVFEESTQEVNA